MCQSRTQASACQEPVVIWAGPMLEPAAGRRPEATELEAMVLEDLDTPVEAPEALVAVVLPAAACPVDTMAVEVDLQAEAVVGQAGL